MDKIAEAMKECLPAEVSGNIFSAAEKAIESLPIILLPRDAKPEVGDVIIDGAGTPRLFKFDTYGASITNKKPHWYCQHSGKIIMRNGKPVVYEEV